MSDMTRQSGGSSSPSPPIPSDHPSQTVEIERSSDYRKIYTNLFRFRITPNDISIIFQAIADTPGIPVAPLKVTEEAEIIMSHSQTKSVVIHLSKLIAAFEREFGPIKTTPAPTDDAVNSMVGSVKSLGFG